MSDRSSPESDRADKMLVSLGLFESRASARAAIEAGGVTADGRVIAKPSETLARGAVIEAVPAHPYVSRGGLKLVGALDAFGVDPAGLACLDLGASTGGFTDVLLSRGAAHVTCVDVGHGQIHPKIAADARVTSHEGLNAKNLTAQHFDAAPGLIVCDLSFVSLAKVIGVPLGLAAPDAALIALFKPQFEVGRENVGRAGLVTDQEATKAALAEFLAWLTSQGWTPQDPVPSPIAGGDGNREWLVCARRDQ